MNQPPIKTPASARKIISLVFLLIISVIPIATIFSEKDSTSTSEKRKLAERPSIEPNYKSIAAFPNRFNAYFKDHFGFRNPLNHAYDRLKVELLKVSSRSGVLLGKSQWSFLFPWDTRDDYFGKIIIPEHKLFEWGTEIESRQRWSAERGIQYYFVLVPEKQTVHPKQLPDYVLAHAGSSIRMQLAPYLNQHFDLNFINLTEPLRQQKHKQLNYYKNDSHWNTIGASFASNNIIKRIVEDFPDSPWLGRASQLESYSSQYAGDLAIMLGAKQQRSEQLMEVKVAQQCARKTTSLQLPASYDSHSRIYECEKGELTALVIHDSFGFALSAFIRERFKRTVFTNHIDYNDLATLADLIKPDVIVDLRVERNIPLTLNKTPVTDLIHPTKVASLGQPIASKRTTVQALLGENHKLDVHSGDGKLGFTTQAGESWVDIKLPQTDTPLYVHIEVLSALHGDMRFSPLPDANYVYNKKAVYVRPMHNTSLFLPLPAIREDTLRLEFNGIRNEWLIEKLDIYPLSSK